MTTATARSTRKGKAARAKEAALRTMREQHTAEGAPAPEPQPPLVLGELPEGVPAGTVTNSDGTTSELISDEAYAAKQAALLDPEPLEELPSFEDAPETLAALDELHLLPDAEPADADDDEMLADAEVPDDFLQQGAAPQAEVEEQEPWTDAEVTEMMTSAFEGLGGRMAVDDQFLVDGIRTIGEPRMHAILSAIASYNERTRRWTLAGSQPDVEPIIQIEPEAATPSVPVRTYTRTVDGMQHVTEPVDERYLRTACGLIFVPGATPPEDKGDCPECLPQAATAAPAATTPRAGRTPRATPPAAGAPAATPKPPTPPKAPKSDTVGAYKTLAVKGGFSVVPQTGPGQGEARLEVFPELQDAEWYAGRRTRLAAIDPSKLYQPKVGNKVGDFDIKRDDKAKTVWLELNGKKIPPVFHDPVNGAVDAMRYGERLSRPNRRERL